MTVISSSHKFTFHRQIYSNMYSNAYTPSKHFNTIVHLLFSISAYQIWLDASLLCLQGGSSEQFIRGIVTCRRKVRGPELREYSTGALTPITSLPSTSYNKREGYFLISYDFSTDRIVCPIKFLYTQIISPIKVCQFCGYRSPCSQNWEPYWRNILLRYLSIPIFCPWH